jgi:hypothetical protein
MMTYRGALAAVLLLAVAVSLSGGEVRGARLHAGRGGGRAGGLGAGGSSAAAVPTATTKEVGVEAEATSYSGLKPRRGRPSRPTKEMAAIEEMEESEDDVEQTGWREEDEREDGEERGAKQQGSTTTTNTTTTTAGDDDDEEEEQGGVGGATGDGQDKEESKLPPGWWGPLLLHRSMGAASGEEMGRNGHNDSSWGQLGTGALGDESDNAEWEEVMSQLEAGLPVHGYPPRGSGMFDWLSEQKRSFRRGFLSEERQKRLLDVGVSLDSRGRAKNSDWNVMYDAMKVYKEQHGTCSLPENHTDPRLYRWAHYQRQLRFKGCLQKEREEKLDAIGFHWRRSQKHTDMWWYRFENVVLLMMRRGNVTLADIKNATSRRVSSRVKPWLDTQVGHSLPIAHAPGIRIYTTKPA